MFNKVTLQLFQILSYEQKFDLSCMVYCVVRVPSTMINLSFLKNTLRQDLRNKKGSERIYFCTWRDIQLGCYHGIKELIKINLQS